MPEPQVRLSHREDVDMERASVLNLRAYRNRMRDLQSSEPVDIAERECNELNVLCEQMFMAGVAAARRFA